MYLYQKSGQKGLKMSRNMEEKFLEKKFKKFEKNKLTRWKVYANIMTVPRLGRVPCKLNNERNEKHQTGAQKCATRSLREVPGLVNYREKRKDKKF